MLDKIERLISEYNEIDEDLDMIMFDIDQCDCDDRYSEIRPLEIKREKINKKIKKNMRIYINKF